MICSCSCLHSQVLCECGIANCDSSLSTRYELLKHFRLRHIHHSLTGQYPCVYLDCPCTFISWKKLESHISNMQKVRISRCSAVWESLYVKCFIVLFIMSGHFDSLFWSVGFSCVCFITRMHVVNCLLTNSSALRTSYRGKPSCLLWRYGKYVDMLIGTLTNIRLISCSPFHSLSLSLCVSLSLFFSPSRSFSFVPYCPLFLSLSSRFCIFIYLCMFC